MVGVKKTDVYGFAKRKLTSRNLDKLMYQAFGVLQDSMTTSQKEVLIKMVKNLEAQQERI